MRRLVVALLGLAGGCASAGAPPGGPDDHAPPQIVAVSPDSGETNVKIRSVEFTFDEVVSDRPAGVAGNLDQIFLISPRNGAAQVSWRRSRITVKPRNGFRANTAYRVTMLPGLVDLRGNILRSTTTIMFSTGPTFPPFSVRGTVFDWASQRPANGAYVEAISMRDTTIVYVTASDSAGIFDAGPLPADTYLVRALIDQNSNRVVDRNEKWDTLSVHITTTTQNVELDAIERDSTPPFIDNVTVVDSTTLRVTFDKPIDPALPLQPALLRLQRADSSQVEITKVEWQAGFERARQARDSARRADSLRAKAPPAAAAAAAAPPPPTPSPGGVRPAPPPPKPKSPPPDRGIVISIPPAAPFVIGSSYRITARGFRNLVGHSQDVARTFTVPKPPPKDTTTKRPAATDTTRKPPGAPPPSVLRR